MEEGESVVYDQTSDLTSNNVVEEQTSQSTNVETNSDIQEPIKNDIPYIPTELSEEDEKNSTIGLPKVNCKEKIIICLDLSSEMEKETFRSRAGDKFSQLQVILKSLRLFINSKSRINVQHEYALVVLDEKTTWMSDFTNNSREIITLLQDLSTSDNDVAETFDISSLFDIIQEKVTLPEVDDPVLPPPYVIRMLFLYGRSNCLIESNNMESQRKLEACPYVFFDSIYIHEPLSEENQCEEIFNRLCKLDEKGYSYIFEVAKNPTKLYVYMAQLLAHPLQRVIQQSAAYKLRPLTPDLEANVTS